MQEGFSQKQIIDNLSKYLKYHNLPITLDPDGICHGLATVFTKYAAEGKFKEFQSLIERTTTCEFIGERDEEIELFIRDVLLCFQPQLFTPEYTQANSYKLLTVNNKPLEAPLKFGMVTNDSDWINILKKIDLQANEALLIGGYTHTIALSKFKDKYVIYDPNHSYGLVTFNTIEEVIAALHLNFEEESALLPLSIKLIRNPNFEPRSLPVASDLYEIFCDEENILNNVIKSRGDDQVKVNTLAMAADSIDPNSLKKMLSLQASIEQSDLSEAVDIAIEHKNIAILKLLIPHIKDNKKQILGWALQNGSGTLNPFLENNIFKDIYDKQIQKVPVQILHLAIRSGDHELLASILKYAIEKNSDLTEEVLILTKLGTKDAISYAIEIGKPGCVRLLLEHVQFGADELLVYANEAISSNQPSIAKDLLAKLPPHRIPELHVPKDKIFKIDIALLHQLKDKGVKFDAESIRLIAKRELAAKGAFLTAIGVTLVTIQYFFHKLPLLDFTSKQKEKDSEEINQSKIIDHLVRYLDYHNLPVEVDRKGICHGLSTVFVKYALTGNLAGFKTILKRCASLQFDAERDSEVEEFIRDVILCFRPELFSKEFSQNNSFELLTINTKDNTPNKPLKSALDFYMVAKDNDWIKVFSEINLQDDETFIVSDHQHTVAVTKREGKYILYDPNSKTGTTSYGGEEALISQLHKVSFREPSESLGLSIRLIRHPNAQVRNDLPTVKELQETYITEDTVMNHVILNTSKKDIKINVLSMAAERNDTQAMQNILSKTQRWDHDDVFLATYKVVKHNNIDILGQLMPYIKNDVDKAILLRCALEAGKTEAFELIVKNSDYPTEIRKSSIYLKDAAQGGNVKLLEQVIEDYITFNDSDIPDKEWVQKNILKADAIPGAIKAGNIEGMRVLLDHVNLTPEQLTQFVYQAIDNNQLLMVTELIRDLPREEILKINVPASKAAHIDLAILHLLQENGANFDLNTNILIAKRENEPKGVLLTAIGMTLVTFQFFIKSLFFPFVMTKNVLQEAAKQDQPFFKDLPSNDIFRP